MTFSRSWLDTDGQDIAYKSFATFQDNLIIWDTGLAINNARAIETADGVTWSVLFSVLGATYGNFNVNDGCGMSVFKDKLFISLRRSDAVSPKVLEYNPIGTAVTSHLPNPQGGGANNYMALEQIVWANKLWVITDDTVAVSDRRVVYYYDGSSWTAITDYDGATYLNFNKIDGASPTIRVKHRTTRFFIFNNDLYLIATRWSTTASTWAWEVWKFDAEDFDNFAPIFDSEDFADGFTLSAILEHDGTVYIVGNEITPGGNPFDPAKLYSSTDMESWTEETGAAIFEDEFDDAARDPEWTDTPNSGTIVEAGNVLTMAVAGATDGNWWQPNIENAPFAIYTPDDDELVVTTKINNYVVNDETNAGLLIGNTLTVPDAAGGYSISFVRSRAGAFNGLEVVDVGSGTLASIAVITAPIWLRMRIKGSGTGSVVKFDYSIDGAAWTLLHTLNNFTWTFVGLHVKNFGAFNAISAPFEFFHVVEGDMSMTGYVFGEASFNGKMYFNCIDPTNDYTWIKYWDENAGEFLLDQEITTNTGNRGGGLAVFNNNALFVGKWKEVWAEFWATSEKQTRRKGRSIPLLEMTFVDKLGNELKEFYTLIDAAAPTRFWQGRIKTMSSLTRAIDDRTGLYKIADMEMTFANHDRKFSKLMTTYILKNQEAKLYHAWVDEPEIAREHIITFFVDDFSIEGTHFNVRFKDATHKYFTKKIPENICTVEEFADIHPDAVGKYMPEVLGAITLGTDYEHPGSIEAIYVDTDGPPYRYLAAAGILHSVTEVFSNDAPIAGADYAVVYAGGRTYLDLDDDQIDNQVTYNGTGYAFGVWNSVNGYVQNPAYVTAYYLQFIMGMSGGLINFDAVNRMATYFENIGEETTGKLIIQKRADANEILRELLFSHGMKGFVAKGGGQFTIDRKDRHNWQIENEDDWIFTQTDLFGAPAREWNLPQAINTINARFNYIPWQNLYIGADSEFRDNFIDERMEDDIVIRRPPLEI